MVHSCLFLGRNSQPSTEERNHQWEEQALDQDLGQSDGPDEPPGYAADDEDRHDGSDGGGPAELRCQEDRSGQCREERHGLEVRLDVANDQPTPPSGVLEPRLVLLLSLVASALLLEAEVAHDVRDGPLDQVERDGGEHDVDRLLDEVADERRRDDREDREGDAIEQREHLNPPSC